MQFENMEGLFLFKSVNKIFITTFSTFKPRMKNSNANSSGEIKSIETQFRRLRLRMVMNIRDEANKKTVKGIECIRTKRYYVSFSFRILIPNVIAWLFVSDLTASIYYVEKVLCNRA